MTATPVVVAGWLGSTNLGDELVYAALVRQLAARDATPVGISKDPVGTVESHGGASISHAAPRTWWRAVGDGGRLVFGGGGLLQDESSRWNVPYHLSRVAVARTRGARIAAVGLGGGQLHRPSEALIRRILAGVPVGARDRATRDQLAALGLDVRLTADLAFSLPAPVAPPRDEIVVCLRPGNVGGGWLPASGSWRRGLPAAHQAATMARTLGDAAKALGCSLRFVAFQADRDGPLHDAIADRVQGVDVVSVRPTRASILDEVARGQVVVAMRFHAAVAALLAGRPVIATPYSGKVAELAEDAPRSVRLLEGSLSGLTPGEVHDHVGVAAEDRASELDGLMRRERGNGVLLDDLLGPVPSARGGT